MMKHASSVCVVVFLCVFNGVFGIIDYCAQNTYKTNSSWLQLNKEASSYEYAIVSQFKGLHCCAKGYRSIEWYKDGKAYPWPSGISSMILYPESANQTIYTMKVVTSTDTGNYTCLLRNDTHVRTHTIHLHVFDKIPDSPKVTYEPKSQQVEVGQSVRLFCEAFVGKVDLPDAHNDAYWLRSQENGTIDEEDGIMQEKVDREDGLTLGAYLVIKEVTEEHYGDYICRISKPDKYIELPVSISEKVLVEHIIPNPVPWKKIVIFFAILLLLIVTTAVLNMQYGLAFRVWFKDHFGPVEDGDGKITDVLICYSQKDAEIVLGVLIPKLESKYNYKCGSREFSSNVNYWHVELAEAARKTRRIFSVLSPASLNENWDAGSLYQAFKQLQALGPPLSCIALKPMPYSEPQVKNVHGETLTSILRTVHVILWERSNDERFWLALRLNLPAKRCHQSEDICMASGPNTTRLTSNSHESLEILV